MLPSFETRKIAEAIEALTPEQIDELPFGVVKLDYFDLMLLRNRAEDKMFPQKSSVLGRLFFVDVVPCLNNDYFKGRIEKARRSGTLDLCQHQAHGRGMTLINISSIFPALKSPLCINRRVIIGPIRRPDFDVLKLGMAFAELFGSLKPRLVGIGEHNHAAHN